MASRKRKGDPWLAEYEEKVVLDSFVEMERKRLSRLRPQFLAHPVLGPTFSSLTQPNLLELRGYSMYRASDLLLHFPGRFSVQHYRKRYTPNTYLTRPSPALNAALTRLVKNGLLRQAWRPSPRRFSLSDAMAEQVRRAA